MDWVPPSYAAGRRQCSQKRRRFLGHTGVSAAAAAAFAFERFSPNAVTVDQTYYLVSEDLCTLIPTYTHPMLVIRRKG